MAEHKTLPRVDVKDADKGLVSAVFSTFDVKDADGDVTVKGAFQDGAPVRISAYGHASWGVALPAGKGTIRVTATEAILDGQFFMSTRTGRDTFETVKQLGELGEWSYGYDVVEAERGEHEGEKVRFLRKLKIHEVSPVLVGAGVGTRTLAVKSTAPATCSHRSAVATSKSPLDVARNLIRLGEKQGSYGYRFVAEADVERRKLALMKVALDIAAADFGIAPPLLAFFRKAEAADFRCQKRTWGLCAPASLEKSDPSVAVFVNVDQANAELFATVAHEVAHASQTIHEYAWKAQGRDWSRGREESFARDYGLQARDWYTRVGKFLYVKDISLRELNRHHLTELEGNHKLAIGFDDEGRVLVAKYQAGRNFTGRWHRMTGTGLCFKSYP